MIRKAWFNKIKSNQLPNISAFITLMLMILFFTFAYFQDQYVKSKVIFDDNNQKKLVHKYIKSIFKKVTYFNNGAVKQIIELNSKFITNGNALVFYRDGKLKEKGRYKDGLLIDLFAYNRDGNLSYKLIGDGKNRAIQINYHTDKTIDNITQLKYDYKGEPIVDGIRVQYHYDKNYISNIYNYKDGLQDGKSYHYFDDGNLWWETTYQNGRMLKR